jgi:hypothetical protein
MIVNIVVSRKKNTGKAKYMEIGHHSGMMGNEDMIVSSNLYEKVKTFKYLSSLLTNQNSIHKEMKYRLKVKNSCCCLVDLDLAL